MTIDAYLKDRPGLKRWVLWLLMPAGQARPRWWVQYFVNPWVHQRHRNSVVCSSARMDVLPFRPFALGNRSTVEDYAVINNGVGAVSIGHDTRVGISSVIIGPVQVGNHVIIAQHVIMSGLNHSYEDVTQPIHQQPVSTQPICIEDECWIGANVVITAGVRIGKHSVVGGGSVVTKDVPPYSVVVGNPARIIRQYDARSATWKSVSRTEPLPIA